VRLLAQSHFLPPGELHLLVDREAKTMGCQRAEIYLIDKQQRHLHRLDDGDGLVKPLAVDGTLAGRVYRTQVGHVATGDGDVVTWLPLLDGGDRLGVLALTVNVPASEISALLEAFASLVALLVVAKSAYGDALEQPRRTASMELAAEMRWALLPPLSFVSPNLSLAGALEPTYHIAGDCFDYAVNGALLHFAIFDAVGHGLMASRIANLGVSAYRNARRQGLSLDETYQFIDGVLDREVGQSYFTTAQLAELALDSGQLRWINAGHPPPMVLRHGRIHKLESSPRPPLGLGRLAGGAPTIEVTSLEPGDRVLLYSDGITEAVGPSGEQFGEERLADFLIRASASAEQLPETIRRLTRAILDYQGKPPVDDATVLLVEWTSQHSDAGPR
jgi:hypothetical protein